MKVKVTVTGDKELQAILAKMPQLVVAAGGPIDRAVTKGGAVVARRARQLAPNSTKTGTRRKQSASSKRIWSKKLKTTIRSVTRRYPQGARALSVIGPKAPEGNAAHFMQEDGRRHVLWGKVTRVALYRIARNWITQSFDETRGAQHNAMLTSLRNDLDKVMRGRS